MQAERTEADQLGQGWVLTRGRSVDLVQVRPLVSLNTASNPY